MDARITAAAVAHRRHMEDKRFCTACKSRTAAERKLFLDMWDLEDELAMGQLVAHTLTGKTLVGEDGTVLYRGEAAA
jgi:hypothetical protein